MNDFDVHLRGTEIRTLKFKAGEPIYIPTIEGIIRIHKVDSRTLRVETPPGIRVHKHAGRGDVPQTIKLSDRLGNQDSQDAPEGIEES